MLGGAAFALGDNALFASMLPSLPLEFEPIASLEHVNLNVGAAWTERVDDFFFKVLKCARDPRSKALELFTGFEREMATTYSTNYSRLPGTNVRSFLLRCTNGPLAGVGQRDLHLVADDYEHARHRHEKFGQGTDRTVIS